MKGEFIRSNIRFLRTLQVIGGITMVLLTLQSFAAILDRVESYFGCCSIRSASRVFT